MFIFSYWVYLCHHLGLKSGNYLIICYHGLKAVVIEVVDKYGFSEKSFLKAVTEQSQF